MSQTQPPAPGSTLTQERLTHTYLRVLMVVMATLMLVAVVGAKVFLDMAAPSLSEYYDNALRDVFVGMLFAIGVCMVAYKGSPLEDFSLNVAGFYALMVALVPAGLGRLIADGTVSVAAVRLTVGTLLLVAALFVWFDWRSGLWAPRFLLRRRVTQLAFIAGAVYLAAFLLLLLLRLVEGEVFRWVHLMAAVGLILSLAFAVASHAWPEATGSGEGHDEDRQGRSRARLYRTIVLLMAAGLPLWAVLTWLDEPYRVLYVEIYEIALFLCFWAVETRRTWPPPRPR